jgi:murein L,D-transpeptidase YafK
MIYYRLMFVWILSFIIYSDINSQEKMVFNFQEQLKYERVNTAINEKERLLKEKFESKHLIWPPENIYLRAFKSEAKLEVWILEKNEYKFLDEYKICKNSGNPGPKRLEGDKQVPEGFYHIDRFNPLSSFYLSLGLNYPNESDKILSDKNKPGNDIFIHGQCVTVGCLPMTDDYMKEIYLLAIMAAKNGQENIPVHIFPFKFNSLNKHIYFSRFNDLKSFWENLEEEYDFFEKNKRIRKYSVDNSGRYIFEN